MLSFTTVRPADIQSTGTITANVTGVAPYEYFWMYENTVIARTQSVTGFTGIYSLTVRDSAGFTHTGTVNLTPTTINDDPYCIPCQESKQLCNIPEYGSFTWSYSPTSQGWISSHTYNKPMLTSSNYFYLINDYNEIHKMGEGERGFFLYGYFNSYIDVVNATPKPHYLNSVLTLTEVWRGNRLLKLDGINYITIRNATQTTGKTLIKYNENSRYVEGYYPFNHIRDIARDVPFVSTIHDDFELILSGLEPNRPSSYKAQFISFWNIARLEFINREDRILYLHDVSFNTAESSR